MSTPFGVDTNTLLRLPGVDEVAERLQSISSFEVEDFEGIEDLSVISNTRIEEARILFMCEFELRTDLDSLRSHTRVCGQHHIV